MKPTITLEEGGAPLFGIFFPDLIIIPVIVLGQILIARLFFSRWRPLLRPAVSRTIFCILCVFWAAIGILLLLRFPSVTFALRRLPTMVRSTAIAVGNGWGMISALSLGIYYVFQFLARRIPVQHSPERRRWMRAAGTAAVAAPFAVAGYGAFVERTNFHVKETDLFLPGLHPDLEGLRIGQLSDLHVSPWLSVRELGRAIDMLNELNPHLTVITGDLITQVGDPLDDTIRELARLRAEAGLIGCLGNHEVYARCQNYTTAQAKRYGIEFLRSEARLFRWGNGILNVAGVDYQKSPRIQPYLVDAEKLVVPETANLLLSHNPDVFPVAVRKGYDAMLSGHTHGGQVTVEILDHSLNLVRFATPYVAGLYRIDGRSCYVTNGIGTISLPVRIGARPEITLARLRKA